MTGERIRDLTAGKVIITVQVRQVITTATGHSEVADDLGHRGSTLAAARRPGGPGRRAYRRREHRR